MAYDYDRLYRDTPQALGPPTPVIVAAFVRFAGKSLHVLDVGCGQGRDALFIARQGHAVTGVDLSPHGIAAMGAAAQEAGVAVTGVVADIEAYTPDGMFNAILFDRTLHMLTPDAGASVLARLLGHVSAGGLGLHRG